MLNKRFAALVCVIIWTLLFITMAAAATETATFDDLPYISYEKIPEGTSIDGFMFYTNSGHGMEFQGAKGEAGTGGITARYVDEQISLIRFKRTDNAEFSLRSLYFNNTMYPATTASRYNYQGYLNGSLVYESKNVDMEGTGTLPFTGWNQLDEVRITPANDPADIAAVFDNIVYEQGSASADPYLVLNQAPTVLEGGTVAIPNTVLKATDNDSDDSTLQFTITSGTSHGQVEKTSNPGVAVTTFTQANIDSGLIQYVHDGSDTTSDAFTFSVSDGTNVHSGQTFNITVTPVYDDPIPAGASQATFDNLTGTYTHQEAIPYTTAIDGFLFKSSQNLGMQYWSSEGQDNTPAVMTDNPDSILIHSLSIKKEDGGSFKLYTMYITDPGTAGASKYKIEGYLNNNNAYTMSSVTIRPPVKVTFNWENIDEIRITALPQTGENDDVGALFDNIVYQSGNATPTDITLSNNSIAENSPTTSTIGTFSTTDADTGDTFTYSLVSGTGSTDNASFTIDGNTLKLNNVSLDYETKNTYTIRVRTTDSGNATYEEAFTITVTDVDESIVISSASVGNIAAPAAGATPITYPSLTTGTPSSYTATALTWQNANGTPATLTSAGKFKAASTYKAVIELTAATGYKFQSGGLTPTVNTGTAQAGTVSGGDVSGNKLTFTVTFPATADLSVAGITVTSDPTKLSYIEGEALSLTGMQVALLYNDGTTDTGIGSGDFVSYSITADPADSTPLTVLSHNGTAIEVACNSQTGQTSALTVVAATYTVSANKDTLAFGNAITGYASAPRSAAGNRYQQRQLQPDADAADQHEVQHFHHGFADACTRRHGNIQRATQNRVGRGYS